MPDTLSREQWQQLIAEQAGNQRTIREFCRKKGIGLSPFTRWKQRLAGTQGPSVGKRCAFGPVAVTPRSDITVAVGSVAVTFSSAVSSQWLASLLKHLQGLSPMFEDPVTVYLHREPIDFRAGINGLTSRVQNEMALSPFTGGALCLHQLCAGRSQDVPLHLLEGFAGILQTEGYAAYNAVVKTQSLTHAGCPAHARRKFDEVIKFQGKRRKKGLAEEGLSQIQKLYAVERASRDMMAEDRHRYRDQHARPP